MSGATIPGQTTLGIIRGEVRSRANLQNGNIPQPQFILNDNRFISDMEIDGWLVYDQQALYELLIENYADDWNIKTTPYQFLTNTNQKFYNLPDDFFNLRGVDWVQAPGTTFQNLTLKPFMMGERNAYNSVSNIGYYGPIPFYKLVQQTPAQLWLTPQPMQNQTIQVWYSPRLTPAAEYFTMQFSGLIEGCLIAIQLVDQNTNDSATVLFQSVAGTPVGNTEFQVGANDVETAANFVACFNNFWSFNSNVVNGMTAYQVNTLIYCAITGFAILKPITVNYQFLGQKDVPAPPGIVTFWPNDGQVVSDNSVPVAGALVNTGHISNLVVGVNGWEEYLIYSACVRAAQKQSKDASGFAAELVAMKQRIITASTNRDSGMPARVTRTSRSGGWYGGGGC